MRNLLSVACALGVLSQGCDLHPAVVKAAPGVAEYRERNLVAVPGGRVDVAGLNLVIEREDFSIDTRIGRHAVSAIYNSAVDSWLWSFEIRYDGVELLDYTGARLSTEGLASGDTIPGTWWVALDERRLRTKGGLVHEFASNGHLEAIYWASDPYPRIVTQTALIDGDERVTGMSQCTAPNACEWIHSISWDASGRLQRIADRAGRAAEFSWDAQGRLIAARDPLDLVREWDGHRYEYGGRGLSAVTNSEGERTEYERSGHLLDVRGIGEENPRWSLRLLGEAGGLYRTRMVDPLGHESTFRYDSLRRLHSFEDPLGDRFEWMWQGLRPVRRIAPDGTAVDWIRDGDDIGAEIRADGSRIDFTYEPDAVNRAAPLSRPLSRAEDDLGALRAHDYDTQGRLVRTVNGAGEETEYAYDAAGQLASIAHPNGVVVGFSGYGPHGHPEQLALAGTTYVREFDAVGNLLTPAPVEVDLPGIYSRSYDADRNPTGVELIVEVAGTFSGLNGMTVGFRSDGRVLSSSGLGSETANVYDELGRLAQRWSGQTGGWEVTRLEWNGGRQLQAVEQPDGAREERAYDPAGRLVWQAFGRGSPLVVESAASLEWANGRISSARDASESESQIFFYGADGRVASVRFPGGDSLAVTWDARSRPVGLRFEESGSVLADLAVGYDGAGREVELALDGVPLVTRSMSGGRLAEIRYGNGLVRNLAWGEGLARTSTLLDSQGAAVAETALLELPGTQGPVCLKQEAETFGLLAASVEETWCLSRTNSPRNAAAPNGPALEWGPTGRPTRLEGRTLRYNEDDTRLLDVLDTATGDSVHGYVYDASGRAIARDAESIAWDAAGRVTGVGADHRFEWDPFGRLVAHVSPAGDTRWRFGGLVETDASGGLVAIDLGEVRVDLALGDHRYRHFDGRGNVRAVTDSSGVPRTLYRYRNFGVAEVIGDTNDPVRFALGREVGDLTLLGHRLLDADAGRFLAPDPVPQLFDPYTYAHGNSILFWDTSGLEGTFHGATAEEWAVSIAFGGASSALLARALLVASGAPPIAAFVASGLFVVHVGGGFPWEGDRTAVDLLRSSAQGVGRLQRLGSPSAPGVSLAPDLNGLRMMAVAGAPALDASPEGTSMSSVDVHVGDFSFSVCAPAALNQRVPGKLLAALLLANLVCGALVVLRQSHST